MFKIRCGRTRIKQSPFVWGLFFYLSKVAYSHFFSYDYPKTKDRPIQHRFNSINPIHKKVSERITPIAPFGNMDISNMPKATHIRINPANRGRKNISFTHYNNISIITLYE
ncbi:hypothetical protein HZI73_11795 [Vallitalea pronyensis]|uniref:Uncharacterized protein n=1 Tax=Vallitalea pronyensis TaxID=1348613 RepID=A0A8J8MJQ3_9FIRM|nr:hypothetical protein [Vallitalea pronyensis]QUI22929.1 hypothetical protein HZI73_11795 [Vallitalea pronyensis]